MSQAVTISNASCPSPPDVPTDFETQNGTATPVLNVLIVDAFDSTENDPNGITSKGGAAAGDPPGNGLPNEVTIYLTNRASGNIQTVGGAIGTVVTFTPPLTAGTYRLVYQVSAYNSTDVNSGAGYEVEGTVIADGVGGLTTVGTPTRIMNGDATVFDVTLVDVAFAGVDIILRATGVAGKTIRWTGVLNFVFGGA